MLALIVAMAVYFAALKRGQHDVVTAATSESELVVAITSGFVQTYSEYRMRFGKRQLPVPASYRADALSNAGTRLLDHGGVTSVVGLPGREIANLATDEQMQQQLLKLEGAPGTDILVSLQTRDGTTHHRTLFPFFATDQACASCHNELQNLTGDDQWKVGDLMGAQFVEQNIDYQLTNMKRQVWLISVLVFLTLLAGSYCILFLYRQFQLGVELKTLATTDSLTGCINRREMYARINRMTDRANGALLMLDLDHFKRINDNYGHAVGDAVILDFSSRIKKALRSDDWAARIGGEEFVIWLPDVKPASALLITERLRKDIDSSPLEIDDLTINYTVSIGLHIVENASPSRFDAWMNTADQLLYRAKSEGRNRIVFQKELMA